MAVLEKSQKEQSKESRVIVCTLTGRMILKREDGLYSPVRVPQTERPG
jgi:hypothetical protein